MVTMPAAADVLDAISPIEFTEMFDRVAGESSRKSDTTRLNAGGSLA
jgi:hypothetical protein